MSTANLSVSSEVMIQLKGVNKWYGEFHVLKDINLIVNKGERIVICGPSGSGKSTMIRCLNRLEEHQQGQILVGKTELTNDLKNIETIRREVGMVFQHFNLFPHLTVLENCCLAPIWVRKTPRKDAEATAMKYLERVKIPEQAFKYPGQLSGGQQQRVAIARAVVKRPKLLLLDEPLSALDYKLRRTMQVELKRLQRELGITFVFVTHDQEEALSMSDRVVVLKDGLIQQLGTPREIYERPANLFTARFVGETNLFPGKLQHLGDRTITVDVLGVHRTLRRPSFPVCEGQAVHVLLRPEDIRVLAPDADHGLAGKVVERNYKGSTLDSVIHLADGTEVLASEFFDEDDPMFDYRLGEPVKVSWVDGWEWLLPVEPDELPAGAELAVNA